MTHPNLFFSRRDVENYKKKINTDAAARERYNSAIADYEKFLAEPVVTEQQANCGTNQHADFGLLNGQANRFCNCLGVKYLVDGDKKCAEKIRELLLSFIKFERWYAVTYTRRTPVPWHADLCSTGTTLALGILYDIIYDSLTEDERKTIARGVLEKGVIPAFSDWVLPESRIHALDSMGHNWWAVCIAEPATALLALRDEIPDEADRLLKLADEALAEYMTYKGNAVFNKLRNFDEQGLFYESIGYNNYGTGTLLRYLWCSERYGSENTIVRNAIPEGLCDAMMYFSYPVKTENGIRYDFLNFGDSQVRSEFSLLAKYAYRTGICTESMKALVGTYKVDLREEIGGLELEGLTGSLDELENTKLFSSGYAVCRKDFKPDSTLFAVKSGFCWNHSHNDSGTFVIFHKGRPFFIDGGTCDYDSPLYHAYYCQDVAHSVLRTGKGGRRDEELYRGTKFPGRLTDSYTSSDMFFVQADSTGPMAHICSRMLRNFIWLDNRILVIFDDVYCHEETDIQFTVHADAEFCNVGNSVLFDNGISKARLISHHPEMSYDVRNGHPDHKEKEDMQYAVLTTKNTARTHTLIHTLELDYDESPTEYTRLESKNASGIIVETDDCVREIWYNHMADGHIMHDNSNNIIAGFDTDAYMLMLTGNKADGKKKAFIVCGSYLRKDGKVLFADFVKKTAEIDM